eukprot:1150332-Pelagomonas_calceolata.AAC.2
MLMHKLLNPLLGSHCLKKEEKRKVYASQRPRALRKGPLTSRLARPHQGSLKTSLGEGRDRTSEDRAGCQQCPETPGLSFS